jgi:hypothetical protein
VVREQLRQLGRRQANETDGHASRPHAIGPGDLVPVVDEGREDNCDVTVDRLVGGEDDFVARLRGNGRQICHLHAERIVQAALELVDDAGYPGERGQP